MEDPAPVHTYQGWTGVGGALSHLDSVRVSSCPDREVISHLFFWVKNPKSSRLFRGSESWLQGPLHSLHLYPMFMISDTSKIYYLPCILFQLIHVYWHLLFKKSFKFLKFFNFLKKIFMSPAIEKR